MRRSIALGMTVLGSAIAVRAISPARRRRAATAMRRRMMQRMQQVMASLPEDSPPKLVMSVLPRVRDQNEQIIALLREQNELLREQLRAAQGSPATES
jgi:hypothetical protein